MALGSYAAGTLLILASALVAILGLFLVRRTYNVRALVAAHEVSGQYLSLVGTMYAVLLGLIVVDAMGRFDQAVDIVEDEANSISELLYLSGRMPAATSAMIMQQAIDYINLVTEREWPLLREGRYLDEAHESAFRLMRATRDWEPVSESEKAVYATAIGVASEFLNARRHRIVASQRGIPTLEWCLVVIGAIVTISLTYVFVFDDVRVQITLTTMVTLLISLNIFLILSFGYPFSGDVIVSPKRLRSAIFSAPLAAPAPHAR
jgi:hypothetical protein